MSIFILFLVDNFVMTTKLTAFFDGTLGVLIIFAFTYLGLSRVVRDDLSLFSCCAALAFSGGTLWKIFLSKRGDKRDFSPLLTNFFYKTPLENAAYFYDFFAAVYSCRLCGCAVDFGAFDLTFYLTPDALTCTQAINAARSTSKERILVVGSSAKDAAMHARNVNPRLHVIPFCEIAPLLIRIKAVALPQKQPLIKRLYAWLNGVTRRNNSARLFSAASLMLALSALNAFSVWFLCFSVVLLAMGIVALFRKALPQT